MRACACVCVCVCVCGDDGEDRACVLRPRDEDGRVQEMKGVGLVSWGAVVGEAMSDNCEMNSVGVHMCMHKHARTHGDKYLCAHII